jgi:hypothetical protein
VPSTVPATERARWSFRSHLSNEPTGCFIHQAVILSDVLAGRKRDVIMF